MRVVLWDQIIPVAEESMLPILDYRACDIILCLYWITFLFGWNVFTL